MKKILLVEDDEMNRDMLSRRLRLEDYDVIEAGDGLFALEQARSEMPDLILMDISLPGLDGWEATRRLKADEATRGIPVIALTAHAMPADRQRCFDAGCDGYETKPIDWERLTLCLDNSLNKKGPADGRLNCIPARCG
jgi:CheY-like chemotaxis protein